MDPIRKTRSLISIIIFLLLSNVAILVFFIFLDNSRNGNHSRDDRNSITAFLEKEIGFSKQQMSDFQNLRMEHMEMAKPFFEDVRSAKDSFYNLLYSNNIPDSVINKDAAVIGEKQMQLDMQMFRYLKKVRDLCTPAQLTQFDTSFRKVVERMSGGRFKRTDRHKRTK